MSQFSPFDIQKHSFASLLAGIKAEVPDLQRPFAWEEEQARDLCTDVLGLVDELATTPTSEPQHFIGSIVTISGGDFARVIDGQQRMTTITLLIGLIGSAISELGEKVRNRRGEHERKNEILLRVDGLTAEARTLLWTMKFNGEPELRFKPSPEIERTYSSFISGGDGKIASETKEPAEHLRDIAKYLNKNLVREKTRFGNHEDIHQIEHLQRLFRAVSRCLIFVRIDTQSSGSGYQLFESLNATGKPLNALDLLKVWMLATLDGSGYAIDVSEQFRELSNDDEDDAKNFITDYYRARLFSNIGSKPTPKELSLILRGLLFRDPDVPAAFRSANATSEGLHARIAAHVQTMTDWQPTWYQIINGELPYVGQLAFEKERFYELVRGNLSHTLPVPLFMQAVNYMSSTDFSKMIHLMERVFFRYKTICNGPVGDLEKVYQWATQALDTNQALDLELLSAKLQEIIDLHCPDHVFIANLQNKLVFKKKKTVRYFLGMIDLYEANPAPAKTTHAGLNFTIEHIDPQNPNEPRQISEEKLHTIGNLCLLTQRENSIAGNKMFAEKKRLLNNGDECTAKWTQRVFSSETWSDIEVDLRATKLIEKALTVFTASLN
jgi:hypothetical protein